MQRNAVLEKKRGNGKSNRGPGSEISQKGVARGATAWTRRVRAAHRIFSLTPNRARHPLGV